MVFSVPVVKEVLETFTYVKVKIQQGKVLQH